MKRKMICFVAALALLALSACGKLTDASGGHQIAPPIAGENVPDPDLVNGLPAPTVPNAQSTNRPNAVQPVEKENTVRPVESQAPVKPVDPVYVGEDAAKTSALKHAGISEADANFLRVKLEKDDGRWVYDVEFYSGNTEYDYEIDALNGNILSFDFDVENYEHKPAKPTAKPTTPPAANPTAKPTSKPANPTPLPTQKPADPVYIGEAAAKAAALKHAGISEADANFLRIKLEKDDGRWVYDVEFYSGNAEYDYEVDALNGSILSFDYDVENYEHKPAKPTPKPNEPKPAENYISLDEAKNIALSRAKLTAGQVRFTETSLERDDGIMVYQIDFVTEDREYEVEINAVTGAVLEYDSESRWDDD